MGYTFSNGWVTCAVPCTTFGSNNSPPVLFLSGRLIHPLSELRAILASPLIDGDSPNRRPKCGDGTRLISGARAGRQAANTPSETSTVVHKDGGVLRAVFSSREGWKYTRGQGQQK